MTDAPPRPVRLTEHVDGRDEWHTAHAAAAAPLTQFVTGYSDYRERTTSFTARRELPSLQPVLIFNLGETARITGGDGAPITLQAGEAFVAGIHARHAISESTGSQSGLHVWLSMRGFQHLLGRAAGSLANRTVPLGDVLGRPGRELGERMADAPTREARFALFDRAFGRLLAENEAMRPELAWAFARLRRHPGHPVADLARQLGWSRKTLNQHFHARFGVSPKTAARLARFERVTAACGAGGPAPWAAIAHAAGYADQSHMIREFTAFSGLTPSRYRARLQPDGGGLAER